jgi:hypothetical protein
MITTMKMQMKSQQISLLISKTEKKTYQLICMVTERIEMLHQDITLLVLCPSIVWEGLTSLMTL